MSQEPQVLLNLGAGRRGAGAARGLDDLRWLVVAALISVLAHVGIAGLFHRKALGKFDPAILGSDANIFRVYRSDQDRVVDDPEMANGLPLGTGGALAAKSRARTLADLGAALLGEAPGAGSAASGEGTTTGGAARGGWGDQGDGLGSAELRKLPEQPSDQLTGQAAVQLPQFDATDNLRSRLLHQAPLGMRYVGDAPTGGTGLGGDDSAAPGAGSGTGGAPGQARQLLAGGGLTPTRQSPPPAQPWPTSGEPSPIDDQILQNPPAAPADWAGWLLQRAPNLPEKLDDDFTYTLSTYQSPRNPDGLGAFFRLDITGKRSLSRLKTMPKDVVFLIDTSDSIEDLWVKAITIGVRDALNSLNPGDRFNIVFFKESPAFFSTEGVQPANEQTLAAARQFLETAKSSGYTDVNRALSRLLVRDQSAQRVYDLILISDGQPTRGVRDTRQIINLITRDNDLATSIYCVGVGREQNPGLLEFLAYRNKGHCVFAQGAPQVPDLIRDLASRLRYPILKNPQLSLVGLDNHLVFPRTLPDIHQGQTLSIYGRYAQPVPFTLRIVGSNGNQVMDLTVSRDLSQAQVGTRQMAHDWAFWKLHDLYSQILLQGQTPDLQRQVDQLRKQYDGLKAVY